jgi:hypothetical protein
MSAGRVKSDISPARKQLLHTQKKIYFSLKTEAAQLLGETPPPIVRYEKEYQKEFKQLLKPGVRIKTLQKRELIAEIRKADVTLIADYHTFAQAQRTALRIIRDAVQPGEKWCIGIEMVPSHLQAELDRFQAGKLSLKDFHKLIDYRTEWGFPWAHYRPLFEWARDHKVRLIALNRPKELFYPFLQSARALIDLRKRDEWAAGIISDIFAEQKCKMIVLYGELHVSQGHLPFEIHKISKVFLKRPLSCVSVHQNHDGLYWKLAVAPVFEGDVARINRSSFCVFSATPWAKLQSLVTWAESFSDPESDEDEKESADFDSEFEADYHHWIATYSDFLAELFKIPPQETEALTIKTADEADFLSDAFRRAQFLPEERKMLRFLVENGIRLYIPRVEILFLASPSANGAAELAAIHLYRTTTGSGQIFSNHPDDFFRMVIESMFGFFGSLLLNPKRKCDLPSDHERRIRALQFKRGQGSRVEREGRMLALKFWRHREFAVSNSKVWAELERDLKNPEIQLATVAAAVFLGRVLAHQLYRALIQDEVTLAEIRELILRKPSRTGRGYIHQYKAILKRIANKRIDSSKQDRL